MIINTETSILSFSEGEFYSIQFLADDPAAVWSITDGELPDGMTLSADGLLSGSPTLDSSGSIYKVTVTATNGGDVGNMDVTIGVKFSLNDATGAPSWFFNLDNGIMSGAGSLVDDETGFNKFRLKQTDHFLIALELLKGGVSQDMDVANFKMRVKEFEAEAGVDIEDGYHQKRGWGAGWTHYEVGLSFSDDLLGGFLSNYEGDKNTYVKLVADLTVEYWQDQGAADPVLNNRTSNPFIIELSRKL